jgi:multidrug efflux pump subunit AcrB
MKTQKSNKKTRNNILKVSAVILAVLLVIFLIFNLQNIKQSFFADNNQNNLNENINLNPPTEEQKQAGEDIKEKNIQEESNKLINNILGISITYIDASASDFISISSVITGAITNSGTCSLSLTKGDYVINKEASTYALPSSSTCMGFDIEKSELSNGTWKVELSVTVNDQTSTIFDEFILE